MTSPLPREAPVAIVGGGAMGTAIAQIAALAGHRTILIDQHAAALQAARQRFATALDGQVAKRRLSGADRDAALACCTTTEDLAAIAPARLVIEAITESLPAKIELLRRIEPLISVDAIVATNTSALSVAAMGRVHKHPRRFCGLHFFNPAQVLPLVEVVQGPATDPAVIEIAYATMLAWGKTPVRTRSTPAFIVNRCARSFYAEGWRMLAENVAAPATLDALIRDSGGFRMGPYELMDLIGHDISFSTSSSVFEAFGFDPRYRPSLLQRELVEAGHFGRKAGRGVYDYGKGAPRAPSVIEGAGARPGSVRMSEELGPAQALIERAKRSDLAVTTTSLQAMQNQIHLGDIVVMMTDGRPATLRGGVHAVFDLCLDYASAPRIAVAMSDGAPKHAAPSVIGFFQALGFLVSRVDDTPGLVVARTVACLANECLDALQQGVASESDIDLAMTKGVNYPVGPIAWAAQIGYRRVLEIVDNLARVYGDDRYRASPLLRRRAATENKA
jgi:3-hydroxybutyryl-CoA dehydrogenase